MFGLWEEINENSSEEEINAFVSELMEYVDLYVTFPKPRGKGGAPVTNDCTSSMLCGFEALGRCKRMDVVIEIVEKLEAGKEHLKGPNFEMWMGHIRARVRDRDGKNIMSLSKLRPDLFDE